MDPSAPHRGPSPTCSPSQAPSEPLPHPIHPSPPRSPLDVHESRTSPRPSSPSPPSPPNTPLDDRHLDDQPPTSGSAAIAQEPAKGNPTPPQTPPPSPAPIPSDHQQSALPSQPLLPVIHHDDKENIPPDAWQQPVQQPSNPKAKKPLKPTKHLIPLSDQGIHKKSDRSRSPLRDITSAAVANRSTNVLRRPRSPRRKPLNLRFAMR